MKVALTLAFALALALPAASATWAGRGQYEPDTQLDVTGGYMWTDADQTPLATPTDVGHRVYFNAFTIQNTGYSTHGVSDNENFATLQTEHGSWPGNAAAMLGVWKDCNADGYIGLGDNALLQYRSEVLAKWPGVGNSICPPASVPNPPTNAQSHNYVTVHNDGTWVTEFLPIGPDASKSTLPDANPYDINDNGARVWADWGRPGDAPELTKCYIGFPPQGMMHSTGALLSAGDCFAGYSVTDTFDGAATGPLAPYSFADSPHNATNSRSQLNKANPWGQPGSASDVGAWDCAAGGVGPSAGGFQLHKPAVPPTVSTSGTAAGTVEAVSDGVIDCNPTNDASANQYSYQAANAPYSVEKTGVYDQADAKIVSDFPMSYNEGLPGRTLAVAGPTLANAEGTRFPLQQGTAQEQSDGLWVSDARLAEDRNPFVARGTTTNPQFVEPVEYMTAYAYLTITSLQGSPLQLSPSGAVGTYGAENCGGFTSGVHKGWDCDATHWGCGAAYGCTGVVDGATIDDSVHVGQTYQLRDVDCYDNSVGAARSAGASWGALTGTQCV